jgi:uncharacterized alpha/beta hydrolase family protein
MKVYKEYYVEDVLQLLEKAHKNGHLMSGCVDSDLASVIYDYLDSYNDELSEDNIYDFIRFEMELQTSEQVMENYTTDIELDDESDINELVEDFLYDKTSYIGNYTDIIGDLVHVFLQF